VASIMRIGQTGFLYHYAIAMILGVALMLWWFVPLISTMSAGN
jgi:NADH-quinone oxidoreductase subunit L